MAPPRDPKEDGPFWDNPNRNQQWNTDWTNFGRAFDPAGASGNGGWAKAGQGAGAGQGTQSGLPAIGQFATDAWNGINGSRDPQQIQYNQGAGQVGGVGADQNTQGRDMQMSLIQQLQNQANGGGPSLAQMQLQKATDANLSNAMALGASQRGAGAAGGLKAIQGQQAQISQGMAGDSAMLRLNEQMKARDALGNQVGAMRGQDQMLLNANADRAAAAAKQQAQLDLERQKMLNESASKRSPLGAIGGLLAAL